MPTKKKPAKRGPGKPKPTAGPSTADRILAAAEKHFSEKGYLGTGMRDLEEAVGIRRGALYYHIGDKENLLFQICTKRVQEMSEQARIIAESDAPAEEKLRAVAHSLVNEIVQNNRSVTVFFRDWIWLSGKRKKEVLAHRDEFESHIESIFKEGIESAGWVDRGNLVVKASLGMFNYSYLWFKASGSVSPAELADMLTDTLLHGLEPRS